MQNHPGYMTLKRNLRQKFMELGLETAIQGFWPNIPVRSLYHYRIYLEINNFVVFQQRNDKGHNIIGIYPGKFRNTPLDSIIVIGAHFDTVSRSPGVEDNGSGSATVLEMARLLQKHHCKLNTTIIFVLFDMEEDVGYAPTSAILVTYTTLCCRVWLEANTLSRITCFRRRLRRKVSRWRAPSLLTCCSSMTAIITHNMWMELEYATIVFLFPIVFWHLYFRIYFRNGLIVSDEIVTELILLQYGPDGTLTRPSSILWLKIG